MENLTIEKLKELAETEVRRMMVKSIEDYHEALYNHHQAFGIKHTPSLSGFAMWLKDGSFLD